MALRSIFLAGLMALTAVTAQAQPPSDDAQADAKPVLDELIVRGRLPGPPWWRVSNATSTLYILVLPEMTPRGMDWDKSILERRMTGANQLITPPTIRSQAIDSFLDTARLKSVESDFQLERVRLARRKFGLGTGPSFDPQRAASPWFAAMYFEGEYLTSHGLVGGDVEKTLQTSARNHRVKSVAAGEVAYGDLKAGLPLDAKQLQTCLDQTLADPAAAVEADHKAAMDWAAGDVRGLLAAPPSFLTCATSTGPIFQAIYRKQVELQVAAFEAALKISGKSVAIVRAGWLLNKDGSLDQLKAKGYQVDTPGRVED